VNKDLENAHGGDQVFSDNSSDWESEEDLEDDGEDEEDKVDEEEEEEGEEDEEGIEDEEEIEGGSGEDDFIDQADDEYEKAWISDSSEDQSISNTTTAEVDRLAELAFRLSIFLLLKSSLMDNLAPAYSSTILAFSVAPRMARRSGNPRIILLTYPH
jgi:hypothetical protein